MLLAMHVKLEKPSLWFDLCNRAIAEMKRCNKDCIPLSGRRFYVSEAEAKLIKDVLPPGNLIFGMVATVIQIDSKETTHENTDKPEKF